MDDRQLIADLLSALEYHTEQTRPIEFSRVAMEAAREYLRKPAQQQEPWGACVSGRVFVGKLPEHARKLSEDEGMPIQWLYTSPPASKPWVGLTDEEIEKGRDQTFSINNPYCPCDSKTMRKAVRWAEAKLREKNS